MASSPRPKPKKASPKKAAPRPPRNRVRKMVESADVLSPKLHASDYVVKAKEVPESVEELRTNLASLCEEIELLEAQLEPVLTEPSPATGRPSRAYVAPLALEIGGHADSVAVWVDRLSALRGRLEI